MEFNLIKSGADLYGIHSVDWYLTRGIPYLLLGFFIFYIFGFYQILKENKFYLIIYLLFPITILSLSKHKEDRFLLPLFPIINIFIFKGV